MLGQFLFVFPEGSNSNINRIVPKSSELRTASGGVHPAAVAVPLVLLLLGGATAGRVLYYFRGRLCPLSAERIREEKPTPPPADNFDNPLYGQTPAISVISNESQS